jgi:hypothetical protein
MRPERWRGMLVHGGLVSVAPAQRHGEPSTRRK